ncbi:hypothetical protein CROQUDRAFT_60352 [Cronartium quercuum f. sp. fusiforme G11]|uniref:Ubiquitin-like domain-containing protein n=1 Tax=Cronartium quercuum f. sp. fusiforme G11 TaxID=708437 RepID=A0A9P6NKB2_9BASI|nr:hypothetical protein CROQUDRAFT_60352 [Cronartium quercuum f. sp. fusiforme G11]
MDPILDGKKLDDEINAIKRHLQAIANQQLKFKNDYASALNQRPRRVNVPQIPLAEPPAPHPTSTADSSSSAPIPLTIKSLKPVLVFNLKCGLTSTIAELKQQLTSSDSSAPPVDSQRWLYKGKALADNKLLKEYDAIQPNETIHLMIKPSTNVLPSAENSESAAGHVRRPSNSPLAMNIPKITMDNEGGQLGETPFIARSRSGSIHTNPSQSPHLGISESFRTVVTKNEFWVGLKDFLTEQFGPYGPAESNARQMWEHWFIASKEWLSASDIARIREAAGISGMAGR